MTTPPIPPEPAYCVSCKAQIPDRADRDHLWQTLEGIRLSGKSRGQMILEGSIRPGWLSRQQAIEDGMIVPGR